MTESGWKPIDTAPKDGTDILGYGDPLYGDDEDGKGTEYAVMHWVAEVCEYWETVDDETKKLRREDTGYWSGDITPTHWQPLPQPPKDSKR